jgi:CheY-like chemotaxis protein
MSKDVLLAINSPYLDKVFLLTRLILKPLGVTIYEAESKKAALEMAETTSFDLVVMDNVEVLLEDYRITACDIDELIKTIRSRITNIPIVILSDTSYSQQNSKFLQLEDVKYFPLPVDVDELEEAVQFFISNH